MFLSRRQFLKVSAGTVAAVAVADQVLALTALQPVIEVGNPVGGLSGPVLGAGLSRPVSLRFVLYVGLFSERHACLPRPGLCPQRRRDAGRTELRSPDL